jgi:hypothetical protein
MSDEAAIAVSGVAPFPAKLATALSKAQRAMRAAEKDRTNPHFGSKYATLAAVWEVIREPLGANGLAVVQQVSTTNEGVCVRTTLAHESGEYVDSETRMPVAQRTPQGYGGAITYARRYGLSALVGVVADEDDDANEASRAPQKGSTPQNAKDMVKALSASIATQKPVVSFDAVKASITNAPNRADLNVAWRGAKAVGDQFTAAQKDDLNSARDQREKELQEPRAKRLMIADAEAVPS